MNLLENGELIRNNKNRAGKKAVGLSGREMSGTVVLSNDLFPDVLAIAHRIDNKTHAIGVYASNHGSCASVSFFVDADLLKIIYPK